MPADPSWPKERGSSYAGMERKVIGNAAREAYGRRGEGAFDRLKR